MTQMILPDFYRGQYFKESSDSDVFGGLSAEDAKKQKVEIKKKEKVKHASLRDKLSQALAPFLTV